MPYSGVAGVIVMLRGRPLRRRAALAIHPTGVAIPVVFLFPNGDAMLDLVNDETARIEGFAAVCGTYPHPDRHFTQPKRTYPMNAQGLRHGEAPQRFVDDAIALLDRELLKRFVINPRDLSALVMIADPSFETDVAARAEVLQLPPGSLGVDRGVGEAKAHSPARHRRYEDHGVALLELSRPVAEL